MQIKRFEAKSMTLALHMIKAEFGPDAVILSARSTRSGRGVFGARREAGVEVTAAQDTFVPGAVDDGRAAARAPVGSGPEPSERSRGLFRSLNQSLRQLAVRRRPPEEPLRDLPEASPVAAWQRHLAAQDLNGELITEIVEHLQRHSGGDLGVEFQRRLESLGLRAALDADSPRVLALVGAAGVGKTTTAIKIAAGLAARQHPTALLTLDDRRIGALAQLRIYADILRLPLENAASPAEVSRALKRLGPTGTVIVDTPGISPGEEERRVELIEVLSALPAAELHLALAVNTRPRGGAAAKRRGLEGHAPERAHLHAPGRNRCLGPGAQPGGANPPAGLLCRPRAAGS